ncbi:unnamed protein product [Gadus morhua 'NCC']
MASGIGLMKMGLADLVGCLHGPEARASLGLWGASELNLFSLPMNRPRSPHIHVDVVIPLKGLKSNTRAVVGGLGPGPLGRRGNTTRQQSPAR